MTTRAHLKASLLGLRNPDGANYDGAVRAEALFELVFGEGTGDLQINRVHDGDAISVPAGAGLDLDLQTLAAAAGETLDANKVKGLWIQADPLNTAAITVAPGVATPWLGMFSTSTSGIFLRAGELHLFASPTGWDVGAPSKLLNLSHGGGAAQAVKIAIIASTL